MHAEHISEYLDGNGVEHILHEGPEYFLMLFQQVIQKGAKTVLSVVMLQTGQTEGYR
jgi:hypothetical protein